MIEQNVALHKVGRRDAPILPGSETILLAEDQPTIREVLRESLESRGYRVLEAQNGSEAFEIAKNYTGPIHVLVTDVIMPRVRGGEVAKLLRELHPGLCVVLISGYSEEVLLENQLLADGNVLVMQKPFAPELLAEKIRECLASQRTPEKTKS